MNHSCVLQSRNLSHNASLSYKYSNNILALYAILPLFETCVCLYFQEKIMVYTVNIGQGSTDGYTVYPTDVLGKDYYVHSYTDGGSCVIAAIEDGTTISFLNQGNGFSYGGNYIGWGSTLTETLNRFETISVGECAYSSWSSNDITGSRVTSDKPVMVIAGNIRTSISWGTGDADHIVDQALPTDVWGTEFALISTPNRMAGDIFCLMAQEANTFVTLSTGTTFTLWSAGDFYDFWADSNTYTYASSTKPVYVVLYALEWDSAVDLPEGGDPFMIQIVPLDQYSTTPFVMGTIDPYPSGEFLHALTLSGNIY